MKSFIHVGTIIGAHGIKGEVKIRKFAENNDIFEKGAMLDKSGKPLFSIKITGNLKDAIIAKIENIQDRNAAEKLKGKELFVADNVLPAVGEGEFYHSQLIGLEVRLENGDIIGKISAVDNFGAGDIIEISKTTGEKEMLPFAAPWVQEVNIKQGFVIVNPVEYL